ncbi:DUF412 domain-containing protein [Idiomarina tyrosinivorans]|uniref:UPF0208 membrane protein YfbV n=1 Tax=Idiomarina tyrosinivorans TaxID=1445662 RepID=A0A432ZUK3_9GAMM|nr:terminus macrodomain insulation protein YfbV [Idiomarina tyrosinivorans]RUO81456.1 DUF412 domain-containing protein [Idiomarina tyrosinivorans]
MWKLLRDGSRYLTQWPQHSVVATMTESRVVPATQLGIKWIPAIAVMNVFAYLEWLPKEQLSQGLIMSLVMLSLPLQGLVWLGWRSKQPLQPHLIRWYKELQQKLRSSGGEVPQPQQAKPTYMDLARILRRALDTLPPHEH